MHYFVSTDADREEYVAEMRPVAQKFREYLQFTTVDTNEYPEMLAGLGQDPGASRMLIVLNPGNGDVFPYSGGEALSAAEVEAFLMDVGTGRVQAFGKGGPAGNAAAGDGVDHDEL